MTDKRIAFYDELEINDGAEKVLVNETLKTIARELVTPVRRSVSIDWYCTAEIRRQFTELS